MIIYKSFVCLLFASFLFSCSGEPKKSVEEKVEKQDTVIKSETIKIDKALLGEWVLERVNNVSAGEVSLNLIFTDKGEFSTVSNSGSEKGTYSMSEDSKKITFKYEKNDDVWTIVELTDSVLTVSAVDKEKKENLYRFKK